ncbi:MAG: hypothetical protein V3S82_10220 [Dehalococcoidia bacterium]
MIRRTGGVRRKDCVQGEDYLKALERLAQEAGARLDVLDPVEDQGPTRLGAVLQFKDGISRELAEGVLQQLVDWGLIHHGATPVHEYNPEHGGPAWYIP